MLNPVCGKFADDRGGTHERSHDNIGPAIFLKRESRKSRQ